MKILLDESVPQKLRLIIEGGHIGMLTGARAVTELYAPLASFLGRIAIRE